MTATLQPSATSQSITIPADNFDLPCTLFVPQEGEASATSDNSDTPRGALIVLHDHYGPDAWTNETAQRLANLGYTAIVPDLFAPGTTPEDLSDAALRDFTLGLYDSRVVGNVLATVEWLCSQAEVDSTRIGVIGWGWGGAYALMAAAHDRRLAVVADIGGDITYPTHSAQKSGSPLNFVGSIEGTFFGAFAGSDPQFPAVEVERLTRQLADHERRGDVKIYDAPARFWRDDRLPQTARLWQSLEATLRDGFDEPVPLYK